ncbi:MAG TPA: SIMPL domain-containing protein [Patescibacteria group bacterium]|nr:SIMPL domain-containing protein [Patescibacteria group bacterium]
MKSIIVVAVIFLCLFLYTKFAGPIPFFVNEIQTTKTNLFQVDGEGRATAVPDSATVSFGVTQNAATVTSAQNQVNTVITTITNKLQQLGIQANDIQTTNYSLNPNYNDNQNITGYSVTQNVTIHVLSIDQVNQAIDTITLNGANLVGQIAFGFSDTLQKKLENQARQEAVAAAKEKAQNLADATGIHLGNIVDVSENNNSVQPPRPLAVVQSTNAVPTNVTSGENTIDIAVTLSYQTY